MRFDSIGVVGAGVIGRSLAQALAQTGHEVVLVDTCKVALDQARRSIVDGLRLAAFSEPTLRRADHAEIVDRICFSTNYHDLAEARFVIENSTESWEVKEAVYRRLEEITPVDCVFAVNTSAIRITRIAAVAPRHPHIIGMHFMNPVPRKRFVEVITNDKTTETAISAAQTLLTQLGKQGIMVRDTPGFVSNRVMMLMINEAIAVLDDETASASDVDAIFVHCFAHAMGPLATADLIGLDTILRTLDVLRDSFGDSKFEASPLLRRMVNEGRLGRKSGAGFFEYEQQKRFKHG